MRRNVSRTFVWLCSVPMLSLPRNDLDFPFTYQDTLYKLARHNAAMSPDDRAFTFLVDGETEEQHLTYGELDERARRLAPRIQAVCPPGGHVLLLYGPGLDYIVAFFACQYAGVVPVPAYPPDPLRSQRTLSRLQAI